MMKRMDLNGTSQIFVEITFLTIVPILKPRPNLICAFGPEIVTVLLSITMAVQMGTL